MVRYPEEKWDIAFVPQFTALAFGAPGLLTIRDEVLNADGKPEIYLAIVFAHELTHAWFGGLIEIQPHRDVWLEEGIATYVSRSALVACHPDADPGGGRRPAPGSAAGKPATGGGSAKPSTRPPPRSSAGACATGWAR